MIFNIPQEIYLSLNDKNPFEALMSVEGECYRDQPARKTSRVHLAGQDYFIKQHFGVGYLEILKNLFRLRVPVISAKNEWRALENCQTLGIKTAKLMGYGAMGLNPAKQCSFVLTRPLENLKNLEQVLQQGITFIEKRKIINQLAKVVRQFHQAGMCHKDMYLCHFLLEPGPLPQLYMMDLHRVTIHPKISKRDRIKDLAALLYSSFNAHLQRGDYFYFLQIYMNKPLKEIMKDPLIKLVFKKARSIFIKDYGYEPISPIFSHITLTDGQEIEVHKLLREIPGHRWVVQATWQEKPVVVKIFSSKKKYQQELAGIARCQAAGILIPQVLHQGESLKEKVFVLIFEFIQKKSNNNLEIMDDLIKVVAAHHNKGLMQMDLHVDNFIKTDKHMYTLDAKGMVPLKNPLDNLAFFIAQFGPLDDQQILSLLKKYNQVREKDCSLQNSKFLQKVQYFKEKRVAFKLKKIFRTCSAVTCWQGLKYRILMRNDVRSPELCFFLRHIEEESHPDYVVERYMTHNIFKKTKAQERWYSTHLDEFMDKPTIKPVALVEKLGFFKKTSYFISRP